jgi:trehalose/maltose transport system substrate-binding protein
VPHPPETFAQMISQAEALARQGKPHYIEIQGASYEGYTVWINAMVLSAGGQILSADGQQVVLDSPAAAGISLIGQLGAEARPAGRCPGRGGCRRAGCRRWPPPGP